MARLDYLWVGVGGFLGASARFGLTRFLVDRLGGGFPYATFVVNLSGSLAIGVLLTLLAQRSSDLAWRLFAVVGFLGGYTTFSTYTFEAVALLEQGRLTRALLYLLGSNLLGLLACYGGMILARGTGR